MKTYTCPAGHKVVAEDHEHVICEMCNLVATHLNRRDSVVLEWTDREEHEEACHRLSDDMDAAFDNQYFSDGW